MGKLVILLVLRHVRIIVVSNFTLVDIVLIKEMATGLSLVLRSVNLDTPRSFRAQRATLMMTQSSSLARCSQYPGILAHQAHFWHTKICLLVMVQVVFSTVKKVTDFAHRLLVNAEGWVCNGVV